MSRTFILRSTTAPFFPFMLSRSFTIVGRSPKCDFIVDDLSVSRRHSEIRIDGDCLVVTDLQSRNGTFVDESRVDRSQVMPGQVIRFGKVAFRATTADLEDEGVHFEEETDPADQIEPMGDNRMLPTSRLSKAQRPVFDLLITGLPEKAIAKRLHLSVHTIHNHARAIFRAFGVHSRVELVTAVFHSSGTGSK